jgi:hypothetical protein
MGAYLLMFLTTLVSNIDVMVSAESIPTAWGFWLFVLIALQITPYVVNIGFRKDWKRWPQIFVLASAGGLIVIDLIVFGRIWAPPLATFIWAWLIHFTRHLGASFVLSAVLATPGCEMRVIPGFMARLTGKSSAEHYCPGPLDRIDRWEH